MSATVVPQLDAAPSVAAPLPDVIPPRKARGPVWRFVRRYPTVVAGCATPSIPAWPRTYEARPMTDAPLLSIENLQVHFRTPEGVNRAVDGVSFAIGAGETLAIVGESGCGKSVTSMSILRLLPEPQAAIAGAIRFRGTNLLDLPDHAMRKIRGNDISVIFQEPMTSLNPVLTVGRQIGETLRLHQGLGRREAEERAVEMLTLVGIPEPRRRVREYPHQLSGGMRQRVMIAIALACSPKLLIADEPTTALDVTIQAQILDLMRDLKRRVGAAIMLITHDLGVVAEVADRVVVMYEGYVRGVHARIDPDKVGRGSLVIVGVVLDRSTPESFAAFEAAAAAMPMLLDCHLVAGDFDYFLKIRVRDMADFNRLHSNTLLALPGVRQTRTFFVMKEVLDNAPMAI